jgi:hypothetical protein
MYNGSITANAVTPVTGFKNRIINGNMSIDQRNAGASVSMTSGTYSVDRFRAFASVGSKMTAQQNAGSVTPPVGFVNYLGFTTTAGYTASASERFMMYQGIEGTNTADLGWGTANAKTVTLSFWVRSSLTGTHSGSLGNDAGDRSYVFSYTISAANTWEYKTITIAGDTSGTWVTTSAGGGIYFYMNLGNGSSYLTTAGAWSAGYYLGATGSVSVVGTTGATLYFTGIQLEVGSTATSFDYRPFGTELQLAQRYFCTSYVLGTAVGTITGNGAVRRWTDAGSVFASVQIVYPVSMRSAPSVTIYGTAAGGTSGQVSGDGRNVSGAVGGTSSTLYSFAYANNVSIGTNEGIGCNFTASAEL